jgi:hypothetical protein
LCKENDDNPRKFQKDGKCPTAAARAQGSDPAADHGDPSIKIFPGCHRGGKANPSIPHLGSIYSLTNRADRSLVKMLVIIQIGDHMSGVDFVLLCCPD